ISMTLWDQQKHADAYEQSGLFQELLAQAKPFLTDSSDWKIQLSEDFTLEYEPDEVEPIVKSFKVVEQKNSNICAKEDGQVMYLRIVSAKIHHGKLEEFKQLYRDEILPALRNVQGCRYAYLTESTKEAHEVFSVTIWDTKENAENYEKSGLFDKLTEKVKHTFSELFQWKMALEKESGKKLVTSDDLKVDYYQIVTGKQFQ
ncbi:MAG: antibiotic biosynthesis monooxygenase family protein, partial [bacterium]